MSVFSSSGASSSRGGMATLSGSMARSSASDSHSDIDLPASQTSTQRAFWLCRSPTRAGDPEPWLVPSSPSMMCTLTAWTETLAMNSSGHCSTAQYRSSHLSAPVPLLDPHSALTYTRRPGRHLISGVDGHFERLPASRATLQLHDAIVNLRNLKLEEPLL